MAELAEITRYIIAGLLTRDFFIYPNGKVKNDLPGGDALFAAVGLRLWDEQIGIISRISPDYPASWLHQMNQAGFAQSGLQIAEQPFEQRRFIAYPEWDMPTSENPPSHYARIRQAIPVGLADYFTTQMQKEVQDANRQNSTLRLKDIPAEFLDASCAHISRMPLQTQKHCLTLFQHEGIPNISWMPDSSIMNPIKMKELENITKGVHIFFTTMKDLQALFHHTSFDVWEKIMALAEMGCENICVLNGIGEQYIYSTQQKQRWMIPAYPFTRMNDITGHEAAFCGGFIAGFRLTYDPLEAALRGNISSSIMNESFGAFNALDFLPELSHERLHLIRGLARKI